MRKDKNMIVPGALLVLMKGNEILLLQRINSNYCDGDYSLVSGHVEHWENFTDAMIREAKEEANITIDRDHIHMVHMQHKKTTWFNHERIHAYFLATKWTGKIKNVEPEKCSDLSWFDSDHLPDNMSDGIKLAIASIKKGIFYSESGW